jgi:hypothetical protein
MSSRQRLRYAQWIASCPEDNPRVKWSIFPELRITDGDQSLAQEGSQAAVSTNRTALTQPSQKITVEWDQPGKATGPDMSYTTSINTTEPAKYAMLVAQLNATYVPLFDVTESTASFYLPEAASVYDTAIAQNDPVFNGTNFVVLTSSNPYVTVYNVRYQRSFGLP